MIDDQNYKIILKNHNQDICQKPGNSLNPYGIGF